MKRYYIFDLRNSYFYQRNHFNVKKFLNPKKKNKNEFHNFKIFRQIVKLLKEFNNFI